MWETWVQSLGWEDPLEKGKATHSSILAWRLPWTVESMGSQRVWHDWVTFTFTCVSYIAGGFFFFCFFFLTASATWEAHSKQWSPKNWEVNISVEPEKDTFLAMERQLGAEESIQSWESGLRVLDSSSPFVVLVIVSINPLKPHTPKALSGIKILWSGTSLVVQWLGLHASIVRGTGLIPSWGTKITQSHVARKNLKSIKRKRIHKITCFF